MTAAVLHSSPGLLTPRGRELLLSARLAGTVGVMGVGWLLVGGHGTISMPGMCGDAGLGAAAEAVGWTVRTARPWQLVLDWVAMLAATMPPVVAPMAVHVAARADPARRARSTALFLLGWSACWLVVGVPAIAGTAFTSALLGAMGVGWAAGPLGCLAAAGLRLRPAVTRALNRCHGTVALRTRGSGADLDALSFGALHGRRCVAACWAPMVLPMMGGMNGPLLAVVAAGLWLERVGRRPRPQALAMLLCVAAPTALPSPAHAHPPLTRSV